jgi:hypothetical protein
MCLLQAPPSVRSLCVLYVVICAVSNMVSVLWHKIPSYLFYSPEFSLPPRLFKSQGSCILFVWIPTLQYFR